MTIRTLSMMAAACAVLAIGGCGEPGTDPGAMPDNQSAGTGKSPRMPMTCGTFAGISHCPIGGTLLTFGPTLTVSNFGPMGTDGVGSAFSQASSWSQTADINFTPGGMASVKYSTTLNGANVSWSINQVQPAGHYTIVPAYPGNGGTYGVSVYNNNVLVWSDPEIDINDELPKYVIDPNVAGVTDHVAGITVIDDTQIKFTSETPYGYTVLPPGGGTVIGNKIVIIGRIVPGAPNPRMPGVNVTGRPNSYTIKNESYVP